MVWVWCHFSHKPMLLLGSWGIVQSSRFLTQMILHPYVAAYVLELQHAQCHFTYPRKMGIRKAPTRNCKTPCWHTSTSIPCPLGQQVTLEGALLMLHSFPRFQVSPINRSIAYDCCGHESKPMVTSSALFTVWSVHTGSITCMFTSNK